MNTKLGAWLLDKLAGCSAAETTEPPGAEKPSRTVAEEPRIRGWTFLDYYSEPVEAENLVPLLIECNFRGRKEGEEGW